jgi:hypothetical protein
LPRAGPDAQLTALHFAARAVHREALVLAYNETLLALAALMLLPILALPLARRPSTNPLLAHD